MQADRTVGQLTLRSFINLISRKEHKLMKINGIRFITPEEVNAMNSVNLEVTKALLGGKSSDVKRFMFSIDVQFDRLTSHKMTISNDDFALLHYYSERKYLADQFTVQARARIVETKWPEKDGRPAHSSYMLQVYCTDELKWEEDITNKQFVNVYLKGIKNGGLKEFLPVARIPGLQEKEVIQEDIKEGDPSGDAEKLPF